MTDADAPTVHPFSNGSQYMDWTAANCETCTKGAPPDVDFDGITCEIEKALTWACLDSGAIPLPMADRMGFKDDDIRYCWRCPEKIPAP